MSTFKRFKAARRGFSLVEILIVVVILGILAAIAVPKFSNASTVSRENSLKEDLRLVRTQIGVYCTQHHDVNPGYPAGDITQTPTDVVFTSQLSSYTDDIGNVSATFGDPYKFGPYVATFPVNPVNSFATIQIIGATDAFTPDGTTGWIYQPATGLIEPNIAGIDSDGHNYTSY